MNRLLICAALDARFDIGDWVLVLEVPSVYLNRKIIEDQNLDASTVETVPGEPALAHPGFLSYAARTQLL
jgi:hypothetical protein